MIYCFDLADIILIMIFSISMRGWVVVLFWFAMAPVAYQWDIGPVYVSPFNNFVFGYAQSIVLY